MSKPTLMTHRKSWDFRAASGGQNYQPKSPVKSPADEDNDSHSEDGETEECSESYVEALEHRLKREEARCRELTRERCQLSAQLQDSAEYISDLERELQRQLRHQRRSVELVEAAAVEDCPADDHERLKELPEEGRDELLCSELAEENDQLREQMARLMLELAQLRDSAAVAAASTESATQTSCNFSHASSQAADHSVDLAVAAAEAKIKDLELKLDELGRERHGLLEEIEALRKRTLEYSERCSQLESIEQSSLRTHDELHGLRHQLEELRASGETERLRAVEEAVIAERKHAELELRAEATQLSSRCSGLEAQLSACRELLSWSSRNSDREWLRVKAELNQVRQASDAVASTDELLRQLADRELQLLKVESQLSQLLLTYQTPLQQHLPPETRHHRRSLLLLGGLRRKTTKEPQAKVDNHNEVNDSEKAILNERMNMLGERVTETLALMEARISAAQATARLTGALKVDCDSWKRRCRALEAAISSSAVAQAAEAAFSHVPPPPPPPAQPGEEVWAEDKRELSLATVCHSAQCYNLKSMTSPAASSSTKHALSLFSRSLAATGRCYSVYSTPAASTDDQPPAITCHQQQSEQQQQQQQQHLEHQRYARTSRRSVSSLGLSNLRRSVGFS